MLLTVKTDANGDAGVGKLIKFTDYTDKTGGLLSAESKNYFVLNDNVGNITSVIDREGNIINSYAYSPFGELIVEQEEVKLNIGFNTKYEDASGLIYYNNRYYDSDLGRFISQDPIFEEGGVNLYNFVENDPINHWDILGFFIVNDAFENNYPNTTKLLENLASKTSGKEYSGFRGSALASISQVNRGLGFGEGPSIVAGGNSLNSLGSFNYLMPDDINIDMDLLNRVELGDLDARGVLEVTLKHELVHQLLYMNDPEVYLDGFTNGIEEGNQFEIFVYGEIVDYSNIRKIRMSFPNLGSLNL